jgi:hypothetical protein
MYLLGQRQGIVISIDRQVERSKKAVGGGQWAVDSKRRAVKNGRSVRIVFMRSNLNFFDNLASFAKQGKRFWR